MTDTDRRSRPPTTRSDRRRAAWSTPGIDGERRRAGHRLDRRRRVRRALDQTSSTPRPRRSSPRASSGSRTPRSSCGRATPTPSSSCSRRWTPRGRTRRSSTSCRGSTPRASQVVSFKQPSSEELGHTFLWRISKARAGTGPDRDLQPVALRGGGRLRVHPDWLDQQRLPAGDRGPEFWPDRYDDLNAFERHLDRNGTKVVKFFLHVSQGRAEAALPGTSRQPRQAVEVQRRRRRRAGALGRVHGGLRGRHHRDVHAVGARGTCSRRTTST